MADEPLPEGEEGEAPKKKSALIPTIIAVVLLSAVGAGAGWFLGGMFGPSMIPLDERPKPEDEAKKKEEAAKAAEGEAKKDEEGLPRISTEENNVIQLEPITTNLAFPTDKWVRLEVALLFKGKPDVYLAEAVHQDISVYLRTVTLQQIEGPRGFGYLKEDLEERADLLTEGKVAKVMFRTFVVE